MAEWFKNYWYLVIVFVIVCAVTAVIMYFAARAYSRHQRDYKNQEKEIKRLLELKEKYQTLSESVIMSAQDNELLEGTALSYQLVLQKIDDNEAAFEEMSDCKKDIYKDHKVSPKAYEVLHKTPLSAFHGVHFQDALFLRSYSC